MAQKPIEKKDSLKTIKNIEKYSKKSKFGKLMYRLIFRSSEISKPSKRKIKKISPIKKSFNKNEGKIIRTIKIETLDPFGYSAENLTDKPNRGFDKFGNSIHLKTKNFTIRNILLFKKHDVLDSLVAKESERLIRRQGFVRSVVIRPISIEGSTDSVDVSVRVLDSWSLIPKGAFSNSKANIDLTERNFFGFGHEFENNVANRFADGQKSYSTRYKINNIKNSFISATAEYNNDLDNNSFKGIKIERLFFSTFTKWAGGISYNYRFYTDSLSNSTAIYARQSFKLNTKDFWAGHSIRIFKGISEEVRTVKLVNTFRYADIDYTNRPSLEYDSGQFYNSEKLYLTSVGIASQKFQEDKYIFNFGIVEDVPYGYNIALTGGLQEKNLIKRAYFGGKFSYGKYFEFGYLSANIEYGTFMNNGNNEEATLRIEGNYFTNLYAIGNWKIRQFIKPSLVFGNNRNSSIKDRLNLDDTNGIPGFNSNNRLRGNKKLLINFQTQTYVPGNWIGFHFSPFLNVVLGSLAQADSQLFNSKIYSQIGIGVLINNDYLVFNSFQFSFSFYPSLPDGTSNKTSTNSFKNYDLQLPDYLIGEPTIVPYR